jgi:hypothetical protein
MFSRRMQPCQRSLLPLLLSLLLLLLQAGLQQTLSFIAFKRLFKAGGYAYLHQVRALGQPPHSAKASISSRHCA